MLTTAYKPTLSCAHCVVSGYSYVYNDSATDTTNTYYTDLKTGVTTNPGFCCRKVGTAFICEEDYKIFNFLAGHASISTADITKVRTLFSNIAASNSKGGEARRDILLSALYAEIGKNITTDAAAILLKWKQTWASAVMYNMINASESSVNGIQTEAKLNILLSYLNAVSSTNYTNTVEPKVFQLITTETNSNLLTFLAEIRMYAVLYAKDATNAAAMVTLLTESLTSNSNATQALASQNTEKAALIAFTQSTTYSSSSDSVSARILSALQKTWLIKNWGYTDYTAAVADFVTISQLTRTVEKGYGSTLNTEFLGLWSGTFSSSKKTEIQQKLYWYKQQTQSQMFNKIVSLKSTIITTESTLTTAVNLLNTNLTALQTNSKTTEITGLMILYAFANMCTSGNTNVTTSKVVAAITQYDAYIKQGAQTAAGTTIQSANYSSASFIVMKYLATLGADKTAKDLQLADLASVFYWSYQLCINSNVRTLYDSELSSWKTQTGGSYLYVRDAMMLVNMKNQGTATGSNTTASGNWTKWLALISGNNVATTDSSITTGSVTATADVMKGTSLTNAFWLYYGDSNVSITTTPKMWADTATVKDLSTQLGRQKTNGDGVTEAAAQLWCHQLVFLHQAMTNTTFLSTFSSSTLTSYIVAGTSSYTAGGTASLLVTGDMTAATRTMALTTIYSASNAANSTYWYKAYISGLTGYASSGLTISTSTTVTVQAPEPTIDDAEPQVLTPLPIDVLAKAATGPIVGATFNNPDPSASGFIKSSDFASKWLGLAACPRKVDVCGTRDIDASTSESLIKIGTTTAMKQTDQCTYIIKDSTGVPQVSLKTVNSGSLNKYKIVYLEYDDKWTGLKMDGTLKTVPDKATAFNWVDEAYAFTEGTLGLFKLKNGTKFRFLNANYVEEIIKDFKALKTDYDAAAATYKTAVTAWDAAATAITAEIAALVAGTTAIADAAWTALPVKPLAPAAPNAYAGVHETSTDLTKFNGYGSPTAGEITLDLDYGTYKYFGVFGQGLTDKSLGYSSVTGTSNKMIILSVYPSSANVWTQSNGTTGTENLTLAVKSTTASTHDLADPGAVTAPAAPTQVDPWKKALDAKWAAYLNPA